VALGTGSEQKNIHWASPSIPNKAGTNIATLIPHMAIAEDGADEDKNLAATNSTLTYKLI
jgi:hypothetical protein